VVAILGVFFFGALGSLAAAEFLGWAPVWASKVVARAANRMPHDQQERWREEWHAELAAYSGRGISSLAWALSLYVGAVRMAHALSPHRTKRLGHTRLRSLLTAARVANWVRVSLSNIEWMMSSIAMFAGVTVVAIAITRMEMALLHVNSPYLFPLIVIAIMRPTAAGIMIAGALVRSRLLRFHRTTVS
jgi:hypothetical protein